jgi:hypothetical protein
VGIWFAAPLDQFPDYDKVTTTPTATNVNATYPASNLLLYDPTLPFISTAQSTVITWNFGAQKTFDVVSLIFTNLTELATWSLDGSNDGSAWSAIQASVGALAHFVTGQTVQTKKNMLRRNHTLWAGASPVTWQYLRVTLNSGSAGILPSIGRLYVGSRFKPATGWQYDSTLDFLDLSQRERTDRGALVLAPMTPLPGANVKMDFLTQTEMMDYIWEFNFWRGSAREMLACLDDTAGAIKWLQKNLLYCTIAEGRRISFDAFNAHSVSYQLESLAA